MDTSKSKKKDFFLLYSVGFNTSPLGATLCSSFFFPFLRPVRLRAV